MKFEIVTIFPLFFDSILKHGVLRRALQSEICAVSTVDLRDFTGDRHRTVDDRPFGGGEGMVLKPEPIVRAIASVGITPKAERNGTRETVILLSAQGRPFTQAIAHELAEMGRIVFICGRYEGVDERVNELLCDRELSVGDYVLSGGELAAAVIVDAVVRLLPGVLGNPDSARFESFGAPDDGGAYQAGSVPPSTHGAGGLLDYPHYTRPAKFMGIDVPEVLLRGDHAEIRRWRRQQALQKTRQNRPEILAQIKLSEHDRQWLETAGNPET